MPTNINNAKQNDMIFGWLSVMMCLRVRAFFYQTVRFCHVYCNFKIAFRWITVIFGTLKDGSLASRLLIILKSLNTNRIQVQAQLSHTRPIQFDMPTPIQNSEKCQHYSKPINIVFEGL